MLSGYDTRLIRSGDCLEVIEYEKMVCKSSVLDKKDDRAIGSSLGRSVKADEGDSERHRDDTLKRARNDLRRLINSNAYQWKNEKGEIYKPVFLTLTFKDNITDLSWANKEFKKFIQRLSYFAYSLENKLKYVMVPEFQKRGAVHYHLVLFNLPYIKNELIEKKWGHGFIKIKSIDEVTNVGAYICKYMTKDSIDDRLKGKKCYTSSKELCKPEEIRYLKESEKGKEVVKLGGFTSHSMTFEVEYQSDYYGSIKYRQYIMKK